MSRDATICQNQLGTSPASEVNNWGGCGFEKEACINVRISNIFVTILFMKDVL